MEHHVRVTDVELDRTIRKRVGALGPTGWRLLLLCLPALVSVALAQEPQKAATKSPDAPNAFAAMKSLAGSWRGAIMGVPITFTIRPVSSGTAILHEGHTEGGAPPQHEVTMFHREGPRLLATHYCDAGNQSRFEVSMSADGKTIELRFLDVSGSTRGGYLKDMAFVLVDANNHTVEGTFVMPDGKPIQLRGEFQRDK